MLLLTLRDLQHRRSRVLVVVLLVSIVLTLLYLMSGLVHQLKTEPERAVHAIEAQHWVLADGVTGPFTAISVVPTAAAQQLSDNASPVVVSRSTLVWGNDRSSAAVLFGHVPGASVAPVILDGRGIEDTGDAVVDESLDIALGTLIQIGGQNATVVGIASEATVLAGLPFVFTELGTAQQLVFQNTDIVSGFVSPEPIAFADGPIPLTVVDAGDVVEDTLVPIESAIASIDLIRILLWAVAGIVVGAVVYLSALERNRDFAILKAVGAGARMLGGGLALQAVIIAVSAALIGGVLAALIQPFFPLPVRVPTAAYWQVPVVAVVIGLVAAVVAVRRVNSTDPAAAFGGAA